MIEIKELQFTAEWSYRVWLYVHIYFQTLFSQFQVHPGSLVQVVLQ
jgi:hypothetical protein